MQADNQGGQQQQKNPSSNERQPKEIFPSGNPSEKKNKQASESQFPEKNLEANKRSGQEQEKNSAEKQRDSKRH